MSTPQVDPLTARLRETLAAAERRYARGRTFGLRLPAALLDELAAGLAPVLRELVRDAVAEQEPSEPPMCPKHQVPDANGKPLAVPVMACENCARWMAR